MGSMGILGGMQNMGNKWLDDEESQQKVAKIQKTNCRVHFRQIVAPVMTFEPDEPDDGQFAKLAMLGAKCA